MPAGGGGACCRGRRRTPPRPPSPSCRCSRSRPLALDAGRAVLHVRVPADHQVGAPARQRGGTQVGVVHDDGRHPAARVLGLARGVGQPLADLGERQPRLVAPVAEAAGAWVVDAEQADPGRAQQGLAVEHRPPVLGEVRADERAVVVVAGHAELFVVLEGRRDRVEAERLPRTAHRGVVARVDDRRGAGGVAHGPRHLVHADVVVPVGDQQDHGLVLVRHAQVEARGRSAASL